MGQRDTKRVRYEEHDAPSLYPLGSQGMEAAMGAKKQKNRNLQEEDSDSVPFDVIFSNPFLEDLAKLWELRRYIPDPETYGK